MTIAVWMPSNLPAIATPCAWLPEENATTPRPASASVS
jgi:hypothetical protein